MTVAIEDHITGRLKPARQIVIDAGGEVVGRTRLQKIAYLLTLAGFEGTYSFALRRYGPYSSDLANDMELAVAFDLVSEAKTNESWGGYSIYRADGERSPDPARIALAQAAVAVEPVILELAATAAYLATECKSDPWAATQGLKPEKAAVGRLAKAKIAYADLRANFANALPEIPV